MPRYYFRHRWYGYKLKSRHRLKEKVLRLMYIRSLRYKEVSMAKYCYCIDGETFFGNYDSREEAISKAEDDLIMDIANCFLEPKDYEFQTAKCVYYEPKITTWAVEKFVEDVSDEVYEYCGIEDYMHDLSKENLKDLTAKLNKTFEEWVKENYKRSVWYATDIEKHVMHMNDN